MGQPIALLLDFGSVIGVSTFERHRETEMVLALPAGTLKWMGPIAPETDPLWRAMQRDEISERDYWATRAKELGEAVGEPGWDMQAMLGRIRQGKPEHVVREEMRELIADAKSRGIRLGILSNELRLFYGQEFLDRMGIIDHFDVFVDASTTNILKPDPRAYELAIEQLQLPAHKILFVDDQHRNIAGAVRVGLQTHHFDLRDIAGNIAAIRVRLRLKPAAGAD